MVRSIARARWRVRRPANDTIAGRHLFAALIWIRRCRSSSGRSASRRHRPERAAAAPAAVRMGRGYGDNDAGVADALTGPAILPWRRAEFAADSTTGPDLLNIEQDVLALATLVAARDSSPPLSIGLFGDWGSGKTFFMGQLRKHRREAVREARAAKVMQRDYPFYKRIVQIEFNAWHYAEGNFWASMVEHILANLRISEEPDATATETLQKHLIDRLGFTEQAAPNPSKKQGRRPPRYERRGSRSRRGESARRQEERAAGAVAETASP